MLVVEPPQPVSAKTRLRKFVQLGPAGATPAVPALSSRLRCDCAKKLGPVHDARLGKVSSNLMIDLHTTSGKLRHRAVRVVAQLANCDYDSARKALEASGWNLRLIVDKLSQR